MTTQTMIRTDDILVVKLGGNADLDLAASCRDLAVIARQRPVVVVHGVSERANRLSELMGHPVRMITSPTGHTSRYTDRQTRDIYVRAAEQVNDELVGYLEVLGISALGLTTIIGGQRKSAIRALVDGRTRMIRDDYSGKITDVDGQSLLENLRTGSVPVLPPMALSAEDGLLNIDGDRAAAAVAAALGALEFVILSNVRGLYREYPYESSFVERVASGEFGDAMGWAQGRMKRKVLGAREALEGGVRRVIIADGRQRNPIEAALNGEGTVFTQ